MKVKKMRISVDEYLKQLNSSRRQLQNFTFGVISPTICQFFNSRGELIGVGIRLMRNPHPDTVEKLEDGAVAVVLETLERRVNPI